MNKKLQLKLVFTDMLYYRYVTYDSSKENCLIYVYTCTAESDYRLTSFDVGLQYCFFP